MIIWSVNGVKSHENRVLRGNSDTFIEIGKQSSIDVVLKYSKVHILLMERTNMDLKRTPEWTERHTQIAKMVEMDMKAGPKWIVYPSYSEYMKKLHGKVA